MTEFQIPKPLPKGWRRCRDCDQQAAPRLTRCYECWLAAQPPIVRIEAAKARLELIPEEARVARVKPDDWPPGRRWCAGCQTFRRLIDCGGSRCRDCTSTASHMSRLRNEFGIDPATYLHLFELQAGRCAICRGKPKTKRLAVDHDHKCCKAPPLCGQCTRGLLCSRCNHELLGAAHDDVEILSNAVRYLTTPPFGGEWEVPTAEADAFEERYGTRNVASF